MVRQLYFINHLTPGVLTCLIIISDITEFYNRMLIYPKSNRAAVCVKMFQYSGYVMNTNLFTVRGIATDKRGIHIIFFLFLHENVCCGYSLEVPQ